MDRLVACLAVALAFTGCGSTDTPLAPLDPSFAKTWSGDYSMTCTGVGTVAYPGVTATFAVVGNDLTAWLACSDGSGRSVVATGSGKSATWTGAFSCPPSVMGACSSWVFSRSLVTYMLNDDGTLTASGVGSLAGCGYNTDCTTSFTGR